LRLRQDIYTFLLRFIDLNFSYSDYNEDQFNFRNAEEYFRSKEHLLTSKININSPLISLSLYDSHDLFTQIYLKDPFVGVQQFLNKWYHFEIGISRFSMFYIKNSTQRQLLIGNLMHAHRIPINQTITEIFEDSQQNSGKNQIQIHIQMFPNGNKDIQIKLAELKLFIQPYFYLMVDHFFREGLPSYNIDFFDKPNEYNTDVEQYPELNFKVSF
jgi:hypothetical protein